MSRTSDPAYRRARARLFATESTCWVCREPVDMSLRYLEDGDGVVLRDAAGRPLPHPMGPSADHVKPVGMGGKNAGELRLAHLRCNKRRQMKNVEAVRPPFPTSEAW